MSIIPRSLFNGNGIFYYKSVTQSMDLKELITQCRNGNGIAITKLYNIYYPKTVRVCRKIVGNHMTAEELAHDAFILALSKIDQLNNPLRFESWLSSISKNVALKYINRTKPIHTISLDEIPYNELDKSLSQDSTEFSIPPINSLMAAIDNLPDGYRTVFKMSVIQGMSHTEIAEILGIAAHSSSSQLTRAKKLLRKSLSSYWALLLALLMLPIIFLLFRQTTKKENIAPIITIHEDNSKQKKEPTQDSKADSIHNVNKTPIPIIPHSQQKTKVLLSKIKKTTVDTTTKHTIDTINYLAKQKTKNDTIISDSSTLKNNQQPHFGHPNKDIYTTENEDFDFKLIPTKNNDNSKWGLNLAYSGEFGNNENNLTAHSFNVPPPQHSGWPPTDSESSTPITNNWHELLSNLWYWQDLYGSNIYENEGPNLTKKELDALIMIAEANVNAGKEEIRRETQHDLPFTISLAFQHRFNQRWNIESGIAFTRLSSQFTIGEPYAGVIDKQKINYVGVPLKISYNWINNNQWSIYSSAGITLEFPVKSSLITDFMLNGTSLLHQSQSLDVPLQWSTGVGIGVQYKLSPNFGIFAEPNLQYFIPNESNIETYRTEHPLSISIPIGFRISW